MADAKKNKNLVKLECPVCHRINYRTRKSKKVILEQTKLVLNKYCKFDRKRTAHTEAK
jgi:ribosomal protein L33